ncbi:general L-amino acid transport system permease protein [Stella humosa]|uniref:General L-amino acid transport system permease protein n=1 Tax=Stella humosa TaxID=94 RepID=A0A3N1KSP1_9PROT|nr:ABC transporter permease subunit [Stella humosa]ROP81288.1 general L-amino acid transport system permease protein [Stella humosa]BBK32637.1 ABC transporter permease [Stella humosa]
MASSLPIGRASTSRWWNRRGVRRLFWQLVAAAAFLAVLAWFVGNVRQNLPRMGIQFGFDFLAQPAGFEIGENLIGFRPGQSIFRAYLAGMVNTIHVAILGILLATILAMVVAMARLSPNWLLSRLAWAYVEVFRNTPLLLQLLFLHITFAQVLPAPRAAWSPVTGVFLSNRGLMLPALVVQPAHVAALAAFVAGLAGVWWLRRRARLRQEATGIRPSTASATIALLLGLPVAVFVAGGAPLALDLPALRGFNFQGGHTMSPEFASILFGLVFYSAAFMAETMRAGILGVRRGQIDAAQSLGLNRLATLRLVVMPQAMRIIVPPLTSQYLSLTKSSSLAVAVGYPDLMRVYTVVTADTGRPIECIAVVVAVYLTLSLLTALAMNVYNRHVAIVER